MKTSMYLIVVLIIAVQATVCGQTPGRSIPVSNALLPVVKHQQLIVCSEKIKPVVSQELISSAASSTASQTVKFEKKIDDSNRQISKPEPLKSKVSNEINDFFVQQVPITAAQPEIQVVSKQLEASVLSGKISLEKFNANNEQIEQILRNWYGSQSKLEKAGSLSFDAKRSMRMAIEMREEANTYPNPSARLGAMQNAEEKEFLALSKQNEVLNMIGSNVCSN